ncbi:NAD-dependent epimerase/dehydratase family protein [Microbacterium thalli]|uniref:NAD(P)-dependent oxidoreductase n=1 Tax=Microbacterium thalli TaxID=3027921 RepID=A0ABT5SGQ3_9MICO|nr:NAD(P)-dependent oxidoreductase [Microbacterium thalli]MDD7928507.1 NAD(P)-dependent oxidoreductase [Microbacterium thalli]MDD7961083.1 NAD(P)-dependent oxidoreductase [Microbacterium thalli]MDN8547939.1 NAD(P)-dependent oxidoreductase [Microbacterium thalli]
MSRILVTGADGEIGRAVSESLVAAGHRVTALSLAIAADHPADRRIIGDATSRDDVAEAMREVDAVAHFAAIPHPSLGTPYDVFRVNTAATFNVLTRAAETGVRRAVIASSINAIGYPNNPHDTFPPSFPLDAATPPDIADAYSLSKLADEATARYAHRRYGIDVVALRFPLVKWPHVLREVADEVRADPARMAREGWAYLTMTDAVRAVELALWTDAAGAAVVPLSARDTLLDEPTAELLRRFAPAVEPPIGVEGHHALVDLTTARTVLGFEPRESIHDGTATPYPALVRSDR